MSASSMILINYVVTVKCIYKCKSKRYQMNNIYFVLGRVATASRRTFVSTASKRFFCRIYTISHCLS